jgi:hypothetical protein
MGDAVERGLECQKTMDGKESKSNGLQNEIPEGGKTQEGGG